MLNYAFTWLTAAKNTVAANPVTSCAVFVALLVVIAGVVVYFKRVK